MQGRFTLVELLAVLGILAILATTALAALSSARRQGATVACQSNLRQLGTALQLYAGEHREVLPGSMPHGNAAAGPANVGWDDVVVPGLGIEVPTALRVQEHPDLKLHGALRQGLRVFGCPLDPGGSLVAGPAGEQWVKRSYLLNTYSLDHNSPRDPLDKTGSCSRIPSSLVQSPAGTPLLCECHKGNENLWGRVGGDYRSYGSLWDDYLIYRPANEGKPVLFDRRETPMHGTREAIRPQLLAHDLHVTLGSRDELLRRDGRPRPAESDSDSKTFQYIVFRYRK